MSEQQEAEGNSEYISPTDTSDKFLETSRKWDKRLALLYGTSGGLSAIASIGYMSSGNTETGIIQGVAAGLLLATASIYARISRK
jgi:hypothetical protein